MRLFTLFASLLVIIYPLSVAADRPITSKQDFIAIIEDKELRRPFVKLRVTPDGAISGRGLTTTVTGSWTWENGYFCRDLIWGKRELGYNCQAVSWVDKKLRFTSDRGTGDYADFSLR